MTDMLDKKVIIDCRMSSKCKEFLINNGYTIIEMPVSDVLDRAISAHPDMSAVKINDTWVIYSNTKRLFDFTGKKIIIDREVPANDKLAYPHDIGLNCAVVGKNIICNSQYTEQAVLDLAHKSGFNVINVRQGYSKCSVCIIDDNAIITEDEGIAKKCSQYDIDVLLLKNRAVKLCGYDYGFIGGCSGLLSDGRIIFTGCIENHPEYHLIEAFCKKYGKTAVSMSDEPLYDVGSIFEV